MLDIIDEAFICAIILVISLVRVMMLSVASMMTSIITLVAIFPMTATMTAATLMIIFIVLRIT
jgi:hypothetical protein